MTLAKRLPRKQIRIHQDYTLRWHEAGSELVGEDIEIATDRYVATYTVGDCINGVLTLYPSGRLKKVKA